MASGGLTYAQMVSMLRLQSARAFKEDARYTQDLIGIFVNAAYHEIDRKLRWTRCTYDITTVADQVEYIVPSSVREYLHVEYEDEDETLSELVAIDFHDWTEKKYYDEDSGTPQNYVQHGDRLYLYPPPENADDTVTIYTVAEPPTLADDGDKPGFPVHLHQLIVDQAAAYLHRAQGDLETYARLDNIVQHKLDEEAHGSALKRGGSGRVMQRGA